MFVASSAGAAQQKRIAFDLKGDYQIIGNVGAYNCQTPTIAPVVGTVGDCGTGDLNDDSPDIFWRAEDTSAAANKDITPANARTTALLTIPAGASIMYARLYWGAQITNNNTGGADTSVTLERPGGALITVTANASATGDNGTARYYQSTADVSNFVAAHGEGAYRISGIGSYDFRNDATNLDVTVGWALVVVYRLDTLPLRNIVLFDGLNVVTTGADADVSLDGILVPANAMGAKLGVVAYEGDSTITGDQLLFDRVAITGSTTALSDAQNPVDDFFNGSHDYLGAPVSTVGDFPQTLGSPGSFANFDIDVVDINGKLNQNDETAFIKAKSTGDLFLLGGFFTSIASISPSFIETMLSYTDLSPHPGGAVYPGDILEFTLNVVNHGNDTAVNTTTSSVIPAGLTYVPGTLRITSGTNQGTLTDAAGDDTGDVVGSTVALRLGTGATFATGGTVAANDTIVVVYRVTVGTGTENSTLFNQATISAQGMSDPAPKVTKTTLSGYNGVAAQRTPVYICDAMTGTCGACSASVDCPAGYPVCNTSTNQCVRCLLTNDCPAGAVCNANLCMLPAPTVTTPANGSATASTMPLITGTATANSTVTVYVDGVAVGTTTASGSGAWSFTAMMTIFPGMHTVSATATVGAGLLAVTSPASGTNNFTIVAGCLVNSDCSGATPLCNAQFNICVRCLATSDCVSGTTCVSNICRLPEPTIVTPSSAAMVGVRPTISGTATAGATVVISIDGAVVGTATADANGNWTFTPSQDLATGQHIVSATASVGTGSLAVRSPVSANTPFTVVATSSGVGVTENSLAGGGLACGFDSRPATTGALWLMLFILAGLTGLAIRRRV